MPPDVREVRSDLAAFAERVLGRALWQHQVEAAGSSAFITVIAKARRTGGTVLAETVAMHTAFATRGCRVLVLSATQDAARRVTESIGATLTRCKLTRGSVVEDFATRIRLTNGSEIVSLPASQRQVRGYGEGVLLVILDEAGFMPSELWTAAHYTALDERANGSRVLMLGTPWGGREHFFRQAFEAGQAGDPDHASFHWTSEVNPTLDRAYLDRMRDRVSPAEYASEVLGQWSDAVGSLFARELLDGATADLVLPAFGELSGPARPIVGIDYGVSFDRSAVAVIYRLPGLGELNGEPASRPRFVVIPFVWPVKTPLIGDERRPGVVQEIAASRVPFAYISTETSGVGAGPSEELRRRFAGSRGRRQWNLVATTNAKKTAGYGAVLGLLEQSRLILPRDPELLRQLGGLRFEQGERGFTKIGADDAATHDDVADALMLAALPYSPAGGRVVAGLAELADPRRAVPDAGVPDLDEPVVRTGGGLAVYRRPPLQSVAGAEVSLPEGVRAVDVRAQEREWLRAEVAAATERQRQQDREEIA